MDCESCKETRKNTEPVPFIVHEADMARMERTIRRLWIALIICILIIAGMFVYESQFETITETTSVEATQEADEGSNNNMTVIGGDYGGETNS